MHYFIMRTTCKYIKFNDACIEEYFKISFIIFILNQNLPQGVKNYDLIVEFYVFYKK